MIIYLSAVVLVLAYFIVKTVFTQDKEVELKSFNTSAEKVKEEVLEEKTEETRFMLLPKK